MPGIRPELLAATRSALEDRRLTAEEWDQKIAPALQDLPLTPTAESRYLLALWASDFVIEPGARDRLNGFLWSRGYRIWPERPQSMPTREIYRDIIQENVGEADRAFDRYVDLVGAQDRRVNIAVTDVGFDLFHPELGPKGWSNPGEVPSNGVDDDHNGKVDDSNGWDFILNRNDLGNPEGDWHGTHVAGIATRGTKQLPVIPIRARNGPATDYRNVIDGMEYAIANGARVMNMSFPTTARDDVNAMRALIARHPDVLFVAAAGNDGSSIDQADPDTMLQANTFPNLVDVAATDEFGHLAGFSTRGPHRVLLAARGSNVLSSIPGARYEAISGTSMAAPSVVNTAGKALVLDPGLTPEQLKRLLAETSRKADDFSGQVGSGGEVEEARVYEVAALSGLLRQGLTADEALEKLDFKPEAHEAALALAQSLVA